MTSHDYIRLTVALAAAALLSACATSSPRPTPDHAPDGTSPAPEDVASMPPPPADRDAILAMKGEYRVSFDFRETVVFAPDYKRRAAKESGAYETVIVVVDEPGHIVLQHLLVSRDDAHVTKHWRQDWTWQATDRFEFTDDQIWRVRTIPEQTTRGAWTQCVHEVSDAPRYCGTGPWIHDEGISTWTSDRSWRPLPRREYTVREDYNALDVVNRHTIVPGGWTHEQDNLKVLRTSAGASTFVARESGFNNYRRLEAGEFDFSPAYDYWSKTAVYWSRVRDRWHRDLVANDGIQLRTPVHGMPLIMATFAHADRIIEGGTVTDAELADVFARYVTAPPQESAAR